ncbi:MAG: peptidylprolyl isomerase, partial [Candidatus Omnitrophica bacterium]|nr:peptidylprolyl isomerase [Candidatus Omnitrophota bacterium]
WCKVLRTRMGNYFRDRKKRKKFILILGTLVIIVIAAFSGYKQYLKKNAVAIVNDKIITLLDLKEKISTYPEFYQEYVKQFPQQALEDFIGEKLLMQQAKRYERHYRKNIKKALENYRKDLLIKEFLSDQVLNKAEISPEEIKNYYNNNLKDFLVPERIHLYEIVVPTEEQARDIISRLSNGEDFSEIAKKESISSSKDRGGDLGMISRGQLMPELEEILFSMKPNQVLEKVVRTDQGFHIIKSGKKQPAHLQTVEEATSVIKQILINQKRSQLLNTYINELKNKSKIVRFSEKLKNL